MEDPEKLSIDVTPHAWVEGEKIYLKDVAEVNGPNDFREALENTYVGFAPGPGKSKTMSGIWIASKIKSSISLPDHTSLDIPEFIRVERSSQNLDEEELLQRYENFIAKRLKGKDAEFKVRRFRVSGNGPFSAGPIEVALEAQREGSWIGYVNLNATVRVNGKVERRLVLSGWIDRFEEVICVQEPLSRHDVITEGDIALARRNVSKLPDKILRSIDDAVGKRVKHNVKAGDVLLEGEIERTPAIKKGDRVTIVAESPSLLITTVGIAKSKGYVGDYIRVKNIMSKQDVIAAVLDSKTVRVGF